MANDQSLPIAEDFHSLQGEGRWTGTPMHFVRTAGCTVGKPQPEGLETSILPILKTGRAAWMCHTYDDRPFWCDTDFHFDHWATFDELLDGTWEKHVCLTGGEPLLHLDKVQAFVDEANGRDVMVHIETSGTIEWDIINHELRALWLSVSPKQNALDHMMEWADEIKLLVDESFNLDTVPSVVREHNLVYIQPINDELMVSKPNFERCMDILHLMPHWHMSVQTHKLLGLR